LLVEGVFDRRTGFCWRRRVRSPNRVLLAKACPIAEQGFAGEGVFARRTGFCWSKACSIAEQGFAGEGVFDR
jgi:hypothetical protein